MNHNEHVSPPRAFLSYARADRIRIAKLAAALAAAGIDVWWDAAIEAGSAFRQDIARELDAADVVVVAWSAASINSAWVLDEAGVGRDRGRLAPILLDAVKPPLGFRQLQSIDLSSWRGDSRDPQLARVVEAVERIAPRATPLLVRQAPKPSTRSRRGALWIAGLFATSFALGLGWHLLSSHSSASRTTRGAAPPLKPIVAVLPFTDMSSTKGEAYFAQGLAEEIQDTLARDGRLKVFGGATARAIRDRPDDPSYARDKLGVTRLLEGSVRSGDTGNNTLVRVSVRLIDTGNGLETWSQSFDRRGKDVISIQEEVASAVATQISGPLSGAPLAESSTPPPPPEAYQNIVVARQLIRSRQADSLRRARDLANAAIKIAPRYAAAFAARSTAMTQLTQYGGEPASTMLPLARRDAETAIRLEPGQPDGFAALSLALWFSGDAGKAIEAAQAAIARRPEDAEAHLHLAFFLYGDDQPRSASAEFAAASSIDPLWSVPVSSLIATYADTNEPARAQAVDDRYRAVSTEPSDMKFVHGLAAMAAGHIGMAIRSLDEAIALNPELTPAIIDRDDMRNGLFATRAPSVQHALASLVTRSMASRDIAAASSAAARLGDGIWDNADSADKLASALVAGGRSDQLLDFFRERFGTVAQYAASASARDRSAVVLALAFDRAKQPAEARALRDFARRRLQRAEAGGLAPASTSLHWAGLLVEEGDRRRALARLEKGVTDQWWAVCQGPFWLGDLPTLAPLRGDARFATLLQRCQLKLNAERALAGFTAAALN